MFTNKIIIFGLNDLAELAHFYLTNHYFDTVEVVAFTVSEKYIKEDTFKGLPVIPFEELDKHFNPSDYLLFAPVTDNNLREKVYREGKSKGYNFFSYISPKCTNYALSIGENCFILEDNTLQPFTSIGNNVIMWSGNHIGHHGVVENNIFFTSHVVMSGHCHIKNGAFLGVNSTLRDGITIGENSIIGMGSVVTKNVPDNETWIGSPARKKEDGK
mgnify:CR=1 FL=1